MHPFLNTAARLSRETGDLLVRRLERFQGDYQKRLALAERVYQDAKEQLATLLKEIYPDHGVSTSPASHSRDAEFIWHLDVINGFENYVRGIPHFAVCLAITQQGQPQLGLIHDPLLDETFIVENGNKAQLNNYRIRVNQISQLDHCLIATNYTTIHNNLTTRNTGCAALMLAYTACGRFDGFCGEHLSLAESMLGSLFLKMAGGLLLDGKGQDYKVDTSNLIAAHPKLLKALVSAIGI